MAKVSILVENESVAAKATGALFNPIGAMISAARKEKDRVIVALDDTENGIEFEASDEAYVLEVTPGEHTLYVQDWKCLSKHMGGTVIRAAASGGFGLMSGSFMNNVSESLAKSAEKLEREMWSTEDFTIRDTQTIHFTCKATSKGTVKIKRMD